MFRVVAICLLLTATAEAGLIDSEWGASQPTGNGQLVLGNGRMEYSVDEIEVLTGDGASRAWTTQLSLDTNWQVQALAHIDAFWQASNQVASIGFALSREGESPYDLAYILLWQDGTDGRRIRSQLGGSGKSKFLTDTDLTLELRYSASERLIRSYYKRADGQLTELQSGSVDGWNFAPGELINLNIVASSRIMELQPGQVHLSDHVLIPEPALALWLALVPLVKRRIAAASK